MEAARKTSVCVLLYGDYFELARRCLLSLQPVLSTGVRHVQDVRLCLNDVCDETRHFVDEWAQQLWNAHMMRIILYIPEPGTLKEPRTKYPLMRRMFYDEYDPVAEMVMWFDDDTYFQDPPSVWWSDVLQRMENCDMVGQCSWVMPVQGQQWEWIKTQPWYNLAAGPPTSKARGKPAFRFCQGAWWVARRTMLHSLNWPIPELRHNGGDSLLGEAMRHQGYQMCNYDRGLKINADSKGKQSGAKRRGFSEPALGKHYRGAPLPTAEHHDFKMQKLVIGECKPLSGQGPVEVIDLPCW